MATATQSTMTLEKFHASKPYLSLTEKQRTWIDEFLTSQDPMSATTAAYGGRTSEAYRRMLADKVLNSPHIVEALDLFYSHTPKEKFLRQLKDTIAQTDGVARVEALKLLARTNGFVGDSSAEPAPQKFVAGDVVRQDGVLYRVASVDASGKILDAVEV